MSVITLNSEQISQLNAQTLVNPCSRPLKHTKSTRWHMVFMAILFIIEFAVSVSIAGLLYQNSYFTKFWISIVFVIIFYLIGLCLGCMAITSQTRDSFLLCILLLLCGIMVIPLLLPIIICIFCIKEALQNYSKIQLMVNIIPLCTYITIQFVFTLTLLCDRGIDLNSSMHGKTYNLSWFVPLSIFICMLYYIDVFTLILFHGQHVLFKYFKSAIFILTTFCMELLLIIMYIMIRFYVDKSLHSDDSSFYDTLITFSFINYVIFSVPFSSIFVVWKWIKNMEYRRYINELVSCNLSIKMEPLYDRFYAYLHLSSHTALPAKSRKYCSYDVNYKMCLEDVRSSLITATNRNKNVIVEHCNADSVCFEYQLEYFKFNWLMKKKYINKISRGKLPYLSMFQRYKFYSSIKCGGAFIRFLYICLRIYSYLFPLCWFFCIYLLAQNVNNNFKSLCEWIVDNDNKYEHMFIVCVFGMYLVFLCIFIRMVFIFGRVEYYYGHIMAMKIDWKAIKLFLKCLKRNQIIINKINNRKISFIVISYLTNNHSSYNWIFSASLPPV